jgi:hypothetical protein
MHGLVQPAPFPVTLGHDAAVAALRPVSVDKEIIAPVMRNWKRRKRRMDDGRIRPPMQTDAFVERRMMGHVFAGVVTRRQRSAAVCNGRPSRPMACSRNGSIGHPPDGADISSPWSRSRAYVPGFLPKMPSFESCDDRSSRKAVRPQCCIRDFLYGPDCVTSKRILQMGGRPCTALAVKRKRPARNPGIYMNALSLLFRKRKRRTKRDTRQKWIL